MEAEVLFNDLASWMRWQGVSSQRLEGSVVHISDGSSKYVVHVPSEIENMIYQGHYNRSTFSTMDSSHKPFANLKCDIYRNNIISLAIEK